VTQPPQLPVQAAPLLLLMKKALSWLPPGAPPEVLVRAASQTGSPPGLLPVPLSAPVPLQRLHRR
jgi:hypothetical protein